MKGISGKLSIQVEKELMWHVKLFWTKSLVLWVALKEERFNLCCCCVLC